MDALTPKRPACAELSTVSVSLRHDVVPSDHPVPNHPSSSRRACRICHDELTGPVLSRAAPFPEAVRYLGFAIREEARHDERPNRIHMRYGLIVHRQLLSTPPCGDAVTLGYMMPEHPDEDLHLAESTCL
jgi:hypothetical protein